MEDIVVSEQVVIPASELIFQFSRSGGPGGQNVNKVNSKATLSWNVETTQALYPATLQRLRALASTKINTDGFLQITSQVHRDQLSNIQACRERLRGLVLEALKPPTIRRPTKPTLGSKRRRLDNKKIQSQKKQSRSKDWD